LHVGWTPNFLSFFLFSVFLCALCRGYGYCAFDFQPKAIFFQFSLVLLVHLIVDFHLIFVFLVLDLQILGYGWAGMLRRYLVYPVEMWWPSNLAQVSLFRSVFFFFLTWPYIL
jgi:hypothetical protein